MPNITTRDEQVYIYTLGKFFIRQGDMIISEHTNRSKRMWEVFKFILSNRGKMLLPEKILDSIWPEKDYADPGTVMRAQMFRLRQALQTSQPDQSLARNLVFSQGCYHWEENMNCWVDVDEFEKKATKAKLIAGSEPEEAIDLYKQAVKLYKGEYLPESSFSEWVLPQRSYYHDIFLSCVIDLTDLLKSRHVYDEIIRICEQAVAVDYFEERIHIRLIEALLAEGMTTRARVHYSEVTTNYYREMGVKPSDAMKSLYRLVGLERASFELDLSTIQEGLKGKEIISGAYLCDAELFRYFYKLERLRSERSGQSVLICLMTLFKGEYAKKTADLLKEAMNQLQNVIMGALRKGDLVTRWNDAQFLLMLPGLNREQANKVMGRIVERFNSQYPQKEFIIQKKVENLFPLEGDSHFS